MTSVFIQTTRHNFVYRLFSFILCVSFALTGMPAQAQVLPYMPPVGQMLLPQVKSYDLPYIVGMRFSSDNIFEFTFILNAGNLPPKESVIRPEIDKIGKYFLAALTVPEKDIWVNLSPYEKDRVIHPSLGMTDLGKDMLGEDYVLKQLSSSLTCPDLPSGKQFWDRVYSQVGATHRGRPGQMQSIPTKNDLINAYNKIWIVPNKIKIMEAQDRAVITEASLKVMTDTDYLAMEKNSLGGRDVIHHVSNKDAINGVSTTDAFKSIIIPIIEKEVNTSSNFAHLRQIYRAIIMAAWFKKKMKDTVLNQVYFNKQKIKGADVNDPQIKEKIYNEYVNAFKTGVYNMVKTERTGNKIAKRQYFSGGVSVGTAPSDAANSATAGTAGQVDQTTAKNVDDPSTPKVETGVQSDMNLGLEGASGALGLAAKPQAGGIRAKAALTVEQKVAQGLPLSALDEILVRSAKSEIASTWKKINLDKITDKELIAAGVKDPKAFRENIILIQDKFKDGLPGRIIDTIFKGHCIGYDNGKFDDTANVKVQMAKENIEDRRFAQGDLKGDSTVRAAKLRAIAEVAIEMAREEYPNDGNVPSAEQKKLFEAIVDVGYWAGMVGLMGIGDWFRRGGNPNIVAPQERNIPPVSLPSDSVLIQALPNIIELIPEVYSPFGMTFSGPRVDLAIKELLAKEQYPEDLTGNERGEDSGYIRKVMEAYLFENRQYRPLASRENELKLFKEILIWAPQVAKDWRKNGDSVLGRPLLFLLDYVLPSVRKAYDAGADLSRDEKIRLIKEGISQWSTKTNKPITDSEAVAVANWFIDRGYADRKAGDTALDLSRAAGSSNTLAQNDDVLPGMRDEAERAFINVGTPEERSAARYIKRSYPRFIEAALENETDPQSMARALNYLREKYVVLGRMLPHLQGFFADEPGFWDEHKELIIAASGDIYDKILGNSAADEPEGPFSSSAFHEQAMAILSKALVARDMTLDKYEALVKFLVDQRRDELAELEQTPQDHRDTGDTDSKDDDGVKSIEEVMAENNIVEWPYTVIIDGVTVGYANQDASVCYSSMEGFGRNIIVPLINDVLENGENANDGFSMARQVHGRTIQLRRSVANWAPLVWKMADVSRITDEDIRNIGITEPKAINDFRKNIEIAKKIFPDMLPADIAEAIAAGHRLRGGLSREALEREHGKRFSLRRYNRTTDFETQLTYDELDKIPEELGGIRDAQRAAKIMPIVRLARAQRSAIALKTGYSEKQVYDAITALGRWAGMVGLMGVDENRELITIIPQKEEWDRDIFFRRMIITANALNRPVGGEWGGITVVAKPQETIEKDLSDQWNRIVQEEHEKYLASPEYAQRQKEEKLEEAERLTRHQGHLVVISRQVDTPLYIRAKDVLMASNSFSQLSERENQEILNLVALYLDLADSGVGAGDARVVQLWRAFLNDSNAGHSGYSLSRAVGYAMWLVELIGLKDDTQAIAQDIVKRVCRGEEDYFFGYKQLKAASFQSEVARQASDRINSSFIVDVAIRDAVEKPGAIFAALTSMDQYEMFDVEMEMAQRLASLFKDGSIPFGYRNARDMGKIAMFIVGSIVRANSIGALSAVEINELEENYGLTADTISRAASIVEKALYSGKVAQKVLALDVEVKEKLTRDIALVIDATPSAEPEGSTGGLDFATADNIEITANNGGVKLSGKKAVEYLVNGQVTGAKLVTVELRF